MAHNRAQTLVRPNVRFGSKADICSANAMSALPPKAHIGSASGMSAYGQKSLLPLLRFQSQPFDHLVCRLCVVEQTFGLFGA